MIGSFCGAWDPDCDNASNKIKCGDEGGEDYTDEVGENYDEGGENYGRRLRSERSEDYNEGGENYDEDYESPENDGPDHLHVYRVCSRETFTCEYLTKRPTPSETPRPTTPSDTPRPTTPFPTSRPTPPFRTRLGPHGRAEVRLAVDGEWGTICSMDNLGTRAAFGIDEAVVFCRSLGDGNTYTAANVNYVPPSEEGPYPDSTAPVWLHRLQCNGDEANLSACSASQVFRCHPSGVVHGVQCGNQTPRPSASPISSTPYPTPRPTTYPTHYPTPFPRQ